MEAIYIKVNKPTLNKDGPLQTSRSLRVYSQVKCTKGHDMK